MYMSMCWYVCMHFWVYVCLNVYDTHAFIRSMFTIETCGSTCAEGFYCPSNSLSAFAYACPVDYPYSYPGASNVDACQLPPYGTPARV